MAIREWELSGRPDDVVVKKYGKTVLWRHYLHPKLNQEVDFLRLEQGNGSAILPVTREGMVVAVRQFRPGAGQILTELPAGTGDFAGEEPTEVARRELLEETGYQADEMILVGGQWPEAANLSMFVSSFLALGCEKVQEPTLGHMEDIEVVLIPFREWIRMVEYQEIRESSSKGATYDSMRYLRERGFL